MGKYKFIVIAVLVGFSLNMVGCGSDGNGHNRTVESTSNNTAQQ